MVLQMMKRNVMEWLHRLYNAPVKAHPELGFSESWSLSSGASQTSTRRLKTSTSASVKTSLFMVCVEDFLSHRHS